MFLNSKSLSLYVEHIYNSNETEDALSRTELPFDNNNIKRIMHRVTLVRSQYDP